MEPHLKTAQAHRFLAIGYLSLSIFIVAPLWVVSRTSNGIDLSRIIFAETVVLTAGCIFVALHLVVAFGAKRKKSWARTMTNLIGVVMLFAFPIGTVIGGYLIWTGAEKWGDV
ncbi:MAG: hypothetical protein U1E04_08125 [Hylemonella sp.]|jgi:hypothetical protein|nr:hypothetical protein [Hylemonella sp.]